MALGKQLNISLPEVLLLETGNANRPQAQTWLTTVLFCSCPDLAVPCLQSHAAEVTDREYVWATSRQVVCMTLRAKFPGDPGDAILAS